MTTLLYAAGAAFIWLIYSGMQTSSWLIGAPMVLAVALLANAARAFPEITWSSDAVVRPLRLQRLLAYLRFALFFLVNSLRGAVDVSLRTLRPTLGVDPVLYSYPTGLIAESDRVLLAATITLMPGTLAAEINPDHIVIHSLVPDPAMIEDIARCERLITNLEYGYASVTSNA